MIALPDRAERENKKHLQEFAARQERCACCWIPRHRTFFDRWPTGIQSHHLVKRSRRVCHLPWNLLGLCDRCHRLAEGERIRVEGQLLPTLSMANCLWLKREQGPDEFDLALIEALNGRGALELLRPDEVLLRERRIFA